MVRKTLLSPIIALICSLKSSVSSGNFLISKLKKLTLLLTLARLSLWTCLNCTILLSKKVLILLLKKYSKHNTLIQNQMQTCKKHTNSLELLLIRLNLIRSAILTLLIWHWIPKILLVRSTITLALKFKFTRDLLLASSHTMLSVKAELCM